MSIRHLPKPSSNNKGWPWTEASGPIPMKRPDGSDWPKISIVTPSYNQGKFLEETIRSVLLQSYTNLEYIIIDGGSTDNSLEIIKKYEPWITYWVSEQDKGQVEAINKGFAKATGQVLGYLNSDDVYCVSALSTLVSKVKVAEVNPRLLLAGAVKDFGLECIEKTHNNSLFGRVDQWLDGGVSLHQPGCLWTHDLWEECGPFRDDLHFIFDRYFFTMCRVLDAKLVTVPSIVAQFRLHQDSKTTSGFLTSNKFTIEWESVKYKLEEHLSVFQEVELNYRRGLRENWELVSKSLNGGDNNSARQRLYTRLWRNPFWLFHRPMAGAVVRLMSEKFFHSIK